MSESANQPNNPNSPKIAPGWHLGAPKPEEQARGYSVSLSYATEDGFVLLQRRQDAITLTVMEYGYNYPIGIPYQATWTGADGQKLSLEMKPVAHAMLLTALGPHNDPNFLLFQIFSKGSELTVAVPSREHTWTIRVPAPPDKLHAVFALSLQHKITFGGPA